MNKALLPILSRLAALASPAHVAPGGARVIADLTHPNPLAALLREVNETILARSLLLESSGGSSLTLDVAGRRVLRLAAATGVSGAERCLAAGTLDDELKDDLLTLMKAVAAPRHELRVTSRPLTTGGDGLSVGLPVALLADLMLVELNEAGQPEPVESPPDPVPAAPVARSTVVPLVPASAAKPEVDLEQFSAAMGPSLVAWVIQGGQQDGASGGAEEMLAPLQTFLADEAEAVVAQLDRLSARPGEAICMILGAALVEGHSVVCARSGAGQLLGVIDGDATPQLLQAWAEARS